MAHVTSGQDRGDFRYHLSSEAGTCSLAGIRSSFCGRRGKISVMDAAGLDRPVLKKAAPARSTPPEGDVAGTHNGLRSHGCFRCLVIRLRRTHWSGFRRIPTGGEFEMSKQMSGCSRAVKQGGSKNGERENSERTFSVSVRNPQGCTRFPDCGLRNGESG